MCDEPARGEVYEEKGSIRERSREGPEQRGVGEKPGH